MPGVTITCSPVIPIERQKRKKHAVLVEIKNEKEEDETAITELASKKMRFEVEVKTKEMRNLKLQKQEAVEKVEKISSELEVVRLSIGKERDSIKLSEEGFRVCLKEAAAVDKKIEILQKKKSDILREKVELREKLKITQTAINIKEEQRTGLERRLDEAKLEIQKFEKEIADLPSAPGYSQEMLTLLETQIATKKKELECPVCFEESAPPIFTCLAQHLICANCRYDNV